MERIAERAAAREPVQPRAPFPSSLITHLMRDSLAAARSRLFELACMHLHDPSIMPFFHFELLRLLVVPCVLVFCVVTWVESVPSPFTV